MPPNNFYKIGHCAQCLAQIMVSDTKGRLVSMKRNYRQADLFFEDGHRFRIPICEKCLSDIHYRTIMDKLIDPNSQAGAHAISQLKVEVIDGEERERGLPIKHLENIPNNRARVKQLGGVNSGY